jgi:hypothetical protein
VASPTVSYHRNDVGGNASVFMPKLTEMLLDSGWEVVYVNADAIGTGTEENPAWDKAYTSGGTIGVIIFKIPDITVGWPSTYLRIGLNWGAANTRAHFSQIAIGNNIGPLLFETTDFYLGGAVINMTTGTIANTTVAYTISVSEHGLFMRFNSTTPMTIFVERLRNSGGEVTEEFLMHGRLTNTSFIKVSPPLGTLQTRCHCLMPFQGLATSVTTKTTQSPNDPDKTIIIGPYFAGGGPFHPHPRLAIMLSDSDVSPDSFIPITVDGGPKEYRVEPSVISTTSGIFAVATE